MGSVLHLIQSFFFCGGHFELPHSLLSIVKSPILTMSGFFYLKVKKVKMSIVFFKVGVL